MQQDERIISVLNQLNQSANDFCKETNGLCCDVNDEYKGEHTVRNLQYRIVRIYYNSFIVGFRYTAHGAFSITHSILESVIYLDKTDDSVGIPLPFVADFCNVNTVNPLCIPCITNKTAMKQAFDCIADVLHTVIKAIPEISADSELKDSLLIYYRNELSYLLKLDTADYDSEILPNEAAGNAALFTECVLTNRFSSDAFFLLLKGKKAKAIKRFHKQKRLLSYERRILNLLESGETISTSDVSAVNKCLESYNDMGVQKTGFKELSAMFISWLVLTPVISLVYLGIFYLAVLLQKQNSIYLMGASYNFYGCFFSAFITAIAVSYFTRLRFYKLLHKKSYEEYCEADCFANGGGSDRFMKAFSRIVIIISLFGCVLLGKWNINFLSNGFVDNSRFFSLKGEYHSYDEVDSVFYRPNRTNDFGHTLDEPSYVLVLKSGEEIDFYEYDEIENYEVPLLGFLQQQGIDVKK